MDGVEDQQEATLDQDGQSVAGAKAKGNSPIPPTDPDRRASQHVADIRRSIRQQKHPKSAGLAGNLRCSQHPAPSAAQRPEPRDDPVHRTPGQGLPTEVRQLRTATSLTGDRQRRPYRDAPSRPPSKKAGESTLNRFKFDLFHPRRLSRPCDNALPSDLTWG